ncbi:hypothetical protein NCCP133_41510 [Cytobacillus sp. NCCP-133]|nr:hypothetical protein NCCP133_41510 [Cytobacillus sp. NCCP-133]
MCLCKKVNQYYLGNDPNRGKAVKLTPTKYQPPVKARLKKTIYNTGKKYVNGKLQM